VGSLLVAGAFNVRLGTGLLTFSLWWAAALAAVATQVHGADTPASQARASSIEWKVKEGFPLLKVDRVEQLRARQLQDVTSLYRHLESEWRVGRPIVASVEDTQYDRSTGRYRPGYLLRQGDSLTVLVRLTGQEPDAKCSWRAFSGGGQLDRSSAVLLERPCGTWQEVQVFLAMSQELLNA
jgi:hypothetical protein